MNATEQERKCIADELHDGVGQAVSLSTLELAQAAVRAPSEDLREALQRLQGDARDIASQMDQLSQEIRPSSLEYVGLAATIEGLCREFSDLHGLNIRFECKDVPQTLPPDVVICLFRIKQEALRNITLHSRSDSAWIELAGGRECVRLSIWDDGVGWKSCPMRVPLE
jgi:signal transduction histidine kinase